MTADTVAGTMVEADTAEAAIAEVHARLGADARILDARKVLRGGVGGFFARQVVQVRAAPGSTRMTATMTEPTPATAAAAAPVDRVVTSPTSPVDRLLEGVDEVPDAVDFATFLRRQLAQREAERPTATMPSGDASPWHEVARPPAAVSTSPSSVVSMSSADVDPTRAPSGSVRGHEPPPATGDGPAWSATALIRLGLPGDFARQLTVAEPADDLAWTSAVAAAVRSLCRPLASGPSVLIGPNACHVGEPTGLPVARSDRFLAAMRPERWIHLVIGGEHWRELLAEDPLAVSWASPDDLPEAIRCAIDLGLVLGYGPFEGQIRRARPVDVATALRSLVDAASRERPA